MSVTDIPQPSLAPRIAGTRHGVILIIASVMPAMAIISLVPVLPMLLKEFGDQPGAAMLVPMMLTVPALCVALLSPLAGWLSDRMGRKRLLVAALIFYALFGLLPIMLDTLPQLIAARVALGAAEAAIMTVATALIGDYFHGERRERWIATQIAIVSLSAIVLIAIGGILGEMYGSRGPFVLYALALPIAAVAAVILFEPVSEPGAAQGRAGPLPYAAIAPIILITFGVGLLFYTMLVQLGPLLALSNVFSPVLIGATGAAANVGVAAGTLIFRRLQAFTGVRLLALGLAIAALGYAGAGFFSGFLVTAGFAVLACIGCGLMLPNMLVWTMQFLPQGVRGRGTGAWTGAFFLGQFAAPIIAGAVAAPLGGFKTVLLLYAGLAAAGVGAAILVARITPAGLRAERDPR